MGLSFGTRAHTKRPVAPVRHECPFLRSLVWIQKRWRVLDWGGQGRRRLSANANDRVSILRDCNRYKSGSLILQGGGHVDGKTCFEMLKK